MEPVVSPAINDEKEGSRYIGPCEDVGRKMSREDVEALLRDSGLASSRPPPAPVECSSEGAPEKDPYDSSYKRSPAQILDPQGKEVQEAFRQGLIPRPKAGSPSSSVTTPMPRTMSLGSAYPATDPLFFRGTRPVARTMSLGTSVPPATDPLPSRGTRPVARTVSLGTSVPVRRVSRSASTGSPLGATLNRTHYSTVTANSNLTPNTTIVGSRILGMGSPPQRFVSADSMQRIRMSSTSLPSTFSPTSDKSSISPVSKRSLAASLFPRDGVSGRVQIKTLDDVASSMEQTPVYNKPGDVSIVLEQTLAYESPCEIINCCPEQALMYAISQDVDISRSHVIAYETTVEAEEAEQVGGTMGKEETKDVKKAHFEQTPMAEYQGLAGWNMQGPEVVDNIVRSTQQGSSSGEMYNLSDAPLAAEYNASKSKEVADEDLVRLDDLISMRIPMLRDLCRLRGLSIEGDRKELIDRLSAVYEPLAKRRATGKASGKGAQKRSAAAIEQAQAEAWAKALGQARATAKATSRTQKRKSRFTPVLQSAAEGKGRQSTAEGKGRQSTSEGKGRQSAAKGKGRSRTLDA